MAILLLTATVTPPTDAVKLARTDPVHRLQDYYNALTAYLNMPDSAFTKIVFVENSGSDISTLRDLAGKYPNKEIEFIVFHGLNYPSVYGRAYGEAKLMDYAHAHSRIISAISSGEKVWKGTGRLVLRNLPKMIRTAPDNYDMYCDMRNAKAEWMDQRFYSYTKDGYAKLLQGVLELLREDLHNTLAAETLLYRHILKHTATSKIIPRFKSQPFISGISGFNNADYSHGIKNMSKDYLKLILRKVAPKYCL